MSLQKKYCWYGVRKGREIGVFSDWKQCRASIDAFPGAYFRGFHTKEDADYFVKGKRYREDGHETQAGWKQSEEDLFKDFLHDMKQEESFQEMEVCEVKEKKIYKRPSCFKPKVPTIIIQEETKPTHQIVALEKVRSRVNVWVFGEPSGLGSIGVYFGPDDVRNSADLYRWKPPIEKTRVGIAACIRAISSLTEWLVSKQQTSSDTTLVVHTESRYLINAIHTWLTDWTNKRPLIDRKNKDLFRYFERQLRASKLYILCVRENNPNCLELVAARDLAQNVK